MKHAIIGLLMLTTPATAHQAVSGWAYPAECCSGLDCRKTACDSLEEIEDGQVRDIDNGQIYSRDKVRPSEDGSCHVCTGGGLPNGHPICVFTVTGF